MFQNVNFVENIFVLCKFYANMRYEYFKSHSLKILFSTVPPYFKDTKHFNVLKSSLYIFFNPLVILYKTQNLLLDFSF